MSSPFQQKSDMNVALKLVQEAAPEDDKDKKERFPEFQGIFHLFLIIIMTESNPNQL